MAGKPIALVVDDDREWLTILEEVLGSRYQVIKAKNPSEADKIIGREKIEIALVDIRLDEEKVNQETGLSVMFNLNEAGIPSIGVTSNSYGNAVRDAFVKGRAKDVWFKDEQIVDLNEKIKKLETMIKNDENSASPSSNAVANLLSFTGSLLLVPVVISILFIMIAILLPNNYLAVIGASTGLVVVVYLIIALFYKKITGRQFTQLLVSLMKKKK